MSTIVIEPDMIADVLEHLKEPSVTHAPVWTAPRGVIVDEQDDVRTPIPVRPSRQSQSVRTVAWPNFDYIAAADVAGIGECAEVRAQTAGVELGQRAKAAGMTLRELFATIERLGMLRGPERVDLGPIMDGFGIPK